MYIIKNIELFEQAQNPRLLVFLKEKERKKERKKETTWNKKEKWTGEEILLKERKKERKKERDDLK